SSLVAVLLQYSTLALCVCSFVCFFFYWFRAHRDLHSFPTRRSSDLERDYVRAGRRGPGGSRGRPPGTAAGRQGSHCQQAAVPGGDRKSTRLNSSHQIISYAVFCLKKKKKHKHVHASLTTTLIRIVIL